MTTVFAKSETVRGDWFVVDATGQRLVIAWADRKGAVTLAIHDARADWRRIAQPEIGPARGAVVSWLR